MKLAQQQLAHFETFGFLYFPGLLADEVDEITLRFENIWARHGGGHHGSEHDKERRSALLPFIDQDKYLSAILDDPRIDDAMPSILGSSSMALRYLSWSMNGSRADLRSLSCSLP